MLFRPISRGVVDEKVTVLSFAQLILRHATSVQHDAYKGQDHSGGNLESIIALCSLVSEVCYGIY